MKAQTAVSSPEELIARLEEPRKTQIQQLDRLIRKTVPKLEPHVMGKMLGYGKIHYQYASGREGDTAHIAVASNANYISIYACAADERGYVAERYKDRLPKASIGKSCVRFKRLEDLDLGALKALLVETSKTGYGPVEATATQRRPAAKKKKPAARK